MGVRLAIAATLCFLGAAPVLAQQSTEAGLRDCEKLAPVQLKPLDPAFRRLVIHRADVAEDKFAAKVGSQFVSTIYHGTATYQADGAPQDMRFICLHAGVGKGAVFIYALPR